MATLSSEPVVSEAIAPALARQPLSLEPEQVGQRLVQTRPFARLGTWSDAIPVVRPGMSGKLVSWMARHRGEATTAMQAWGRCLAANPECFQSFQLIRLEQPSFFLPAGDVVFDYAINPSQIPENPPRGVQWRHLEALEMFPEATFYFLQPVFTTHRGFTELYSAGDLREDAAIDRDNVIFASRAYGWLFRSAAFAEDRLNDIRDHAKACVRKVRHAWYRYREHRERLSVRRAAADAVSLHRERAEHFYRRARQLGLRDEARLLKQALEQIDAVLIQMRIDSLAGSGFVAPASRHEIDRVVKRAHAQGTTTNERALKRSVRREFEMLRRFDPILCFELPDRPSELWFEAHWYVGVDRKTYVHY